jgi:hypothetical protein
MYMGVMDSAGSAPTTRSGFSGLAVEAVVFAAVDELLQAVARLSVRAVAMIAAAGVALRWRRR